MSQKYVPEGAFLVCTEGMKKSEIKVSSQSTIKISGGKWAGTINDRFSGNFVCSKMMLAGAIIGAIAAAIFVAATVLSGGTIGVGLAMAIGAAAATGGAVQGAMMAIMPSICSMLCSGAKWYPVQDKVLLEKQPALLENSKITCFFGGQVMIFYSEKMADEFVSLVRNNTLIKIGGTIFGSALLSGAIAGIFTASATFFKNVAFVKNTFGGKAAFLYLGENAVYFGAGMGFSMGADYAKGKGYEFIQDETGFRIKDYADRKVIEEADVRIINQNNMETNSISNQSFRETAQYLQNINDGSDEFKTPNKTEYEELQYDRKTMLNTNRGAVEEFSFDKESTKGDNTIIEKHPYRERLSDIVENESDPSGIYYNKESYVYEKGLQFHKITRKELKTNVINIIEKNVSKKEILRDIKSKEGVLGVVIDVYDILSNMFLEGNIESLNETEKEENKAKNGITVKTETK